MKTEEIKLFTNKINFHNQLYPIGFIESLNILNEKIDAFIYNNDWAANEFITNLTKCINCKNELNRKTCTTYKEAVVYFISKIPQKCFNRCLTCSACKTQHYQSYYINNLNKKYFYSDILESDFISFTNKTIFERKIFDTLTADIIYKHSTFKGFCGSYNSIYSNDKTLRNHLVEHRLRENWFYYHLLKYQKEHYKLNEFNAPNMEHFDERLKEIRNELFPSFVKKWNGEFHSKNCKHKNCSAILNEDGNWKVNRLKCAYEDIYVNSKELKPIKIGCTRVPCRNTLKSL